MLTVKRIPCRRTRHPGVYRLLDGTGHLVRAAVPDPNTGKRTEIFRVLRDEPSAARAAAWLDDEKRKIRTGLGRHPEEARTIPKLKDFAELLFEEKSQNGDLTSASSRQKWFVVLTKHLYPAPFADYYLDRIKRADVLAWKATIKIGRNRKKGEVSPVYANDWLVLLGTISRAAALRYDIPDFTFGVPKFSTKHWRPRLRDAPVNLTPEELAIFLGIYRERHPDTYAMVALGYMIGARPSSLRPIRYRGKSADYNPKTGVLVLRRSHTIGEEVMESTKNGDDVTVVLPEPMREILRWHIDTFLVERTIKGTNRINKSSQRMAASELLFPSPDTGSFHVAGRLGKPFDDVSAVMRERVPGFTKTITPKSMRRTNKDLLRQEGVSQLVAQAINSHHDPKMHAHYSTISEAEKAEALAKVVRLFPAPPARTNDATSAAPGDR